MVVEDKGEDVIRPKCATKSGGVIVGTPGGGCRNVACNVERYKSSHTVSNAARLDDESGEKGAMQRIRRGGVEKTKKTSEEKKMRQGKDKHDQPKKKNESKEKIETNIRN